MVGVEQILAAAHSPSALVPLLFISLQGEPNADNVQLCLTAINSLALQSETNKSLLGDYEAPYAVRLSMARFSSHSKITELACAAIAGLAIDHQMNQSRFCIAGPGGEVPDTREQIVKIVEQSTDKEVQVNAMTAISALAMDNTENATILVKAGAKNAVETAMQKWSEDERVLTAGEIALQELFDAVEEDPSD